MSGNLSAAKLRDCNDQRMVNLGIFMVIWALGNVAEAATLSTGGLTTNKEFSFFGYIYIFP